MTSDADQTELRRLVRDLLEKRKQHAVIIGLASVAKSLDSKIDMEIEAISALDAVTEAACAVENFRGIMKAKAP